MRRSRPLLALVAPALACGVLAASTAPALAQAAPPAPVAPAASDDQVVAVAIELFRTRARLDLVAAKVTETEAALAAAQAALAESEQKFEEAKAKVEALRSELQGRAAIIYQSQGGKLDAVLSLERAQDLAVGERYTDAAAGDGNARLEQLQALEAELEQERERRDAARQAIAGEKAQLDQQRADLDAVRARDQAMLDRMGGVPIMGDARLTAEQLAAWYRSTGQSPHLDARMSIDELAKIYIEEGAAEHVRGDLAFAQAIVETGSFTEVPTNNFAGIGTCDSCDHGYAFPTPRDGVRAQIQLLRSYADPDSRASNLKNPPEPGVFGSDPFTAALSYDTFSLKGTAPVWNVMGNGNWATDPDYAHKVLEIYARMIGFTELQHG